MLYQKTPPVQTAPERALQLHQTTPNPTIFLIQESPTVSLPKGNPKYFQDLRLQFCLLVFIKGVHPGISFSSGFPISDFFNDGHACLDIP